MRREDATHDLDLTIQMFGGMSIRDSRGGDFLPRSRKTRALVALLAMSAPRPMLRSQLTGLLWSRREKEQARASLRQSVHELLETLGPAWNRIVAAERHHLAMDLRGVSVDALEAAEAGASGTKLLGLCQDGFLEDLSGLDPAFDDWLGRERRRMLAAARQAAETTLREIEAQDGDPAEAARALLRVDPVHEQAWRALIEHHIRSGDRAAALFACEQWQDALGIVADEEVPEELTALRARLRPGAPAYKNGRSRALTIQSAALTVAPANEEAGWGEPGPARSSLRIGIREMRVLGGAPGDPLPAGLAAEITTALSRFRWISCVSAAEIARSGRESRRAEGGLDMVLDGTIQYGGGRVRISVRLLDMRSGGEVIWAHRFDRDDTDTLAIQDDIGAAIVARVDPVLLMREGERAAARNTWSTSPRDLLLQAVPAIYRLDKTGFDAAGQKLEDALRIDPRSAEAHAWFAYWHLFKVGQGWAADPDGATERAAELADTAVALDPNDARALTLAGHVRGFLMKRASEASVLHERAIALNPNLAIAWCFSGFALSYDGEHAEAIRRMRQAILLSPSDPHLFFFKAAIVTPHLLLGEHEAAAAAGREAVELNPWFSSAFKAYLAVLGHQGRREEADAARQRLLKLEPGFTVADAVRRSPLKRREDLEHYAEGLRRAGLTEA